MMSKCQPNPELKDFSGLAPLFPLPNVVLFPNALLPLQIFEPRYREMTADVLAGERLIGMSLLRRGWERLPASAVPPVHPIVGLGKIIAHEKLDDGRYYLILRGVARTRLLGEQSVDLPYRIGQLEICVETECGDPGFDRQERAEELTSLFIQLFPEVNLRQLFLEAVTDLPLGNVCDVLLGAVPMKSELSQQFLEEMNADMRSEMLLEVLRRATSQPEFAGLSPSANRTFPPDFSTN